MPALHELPIDQIEGFTIGHWTDRDAATGCTVIVAPEGATGAVDVRGGAPASRETDLLRAEETVQQVHAVCLSGGSAFGLEAASGVARELERRGLGLDVGPTKVPIVCSSCLFDLAFGDAFTRPGVDAGIQATASALDQGCSTEEGTVGAGTGATVGKLLGMDRGMKGGLGMRALQLGSLKVGAIAAVNACGNVVDPLTHEPIAGARDASDGKAIIDLEDGMLAAADGLTMPLDRTNTTISCIITNASLTKAQATKVAQMAADAYAHVIRPTHTTNDGDTIYVMASGTMEQNAPNYPLDLIGLVATRALEAALAAGCTEATGICGLPVAKDLAR